MSESSNKIIQEIAKKLQKPVEAITPDAKIVEDLGADSLEVVEVIMHLEETFNVKIKEEDQEKLLTIGDLVAYVEAQLK